MKTLATNGVVLHVDDQGPEDRPALVFSNSLGSDLRVWQPLLPHLRHDMRIIRYDKRGHGLSAFPGGPFSIDDLASDLAGLLDHLGVRDAVIVGLSVGGMIAQALAAARPDLVRGLVLCDTAHKIGPPDIWETRIQAISQGGIAAISEAVLERWFSADFRASRPDDLALWRAMLTRTPVEGYLATCMAIRDADLTEATAGLQLPVTCVVGSEDGATPPALVKSTAELIGADFVEIEGAGHLPCVETPKTLAEIIDDFLEMNHMV